MLVETGRALRAARDGLEQAQAVGGLLAESGGRAERRNRPEEVAGKGLSAHVGAGRAGQGVPAEGDTGEPIADESQWGSEDPGRAGDEREVTDDVGDVGDHVGIRHGVAHQRRVPHHVAEQADRAVQQSWTVRGILAGLLELSGTFLGQLGVLVFEPLRAFLDLVVPLLRRVERRLGLPRGFRVTAGDLGDEHADAAERGQRRVGPRLLDPPFRVRGLGFEPAGRALQRGQVRVPGAERRGRGGHGRGGVVQVPGELADRPAERLGGLALPAAGLGDPGHGGAGLGQRGGHGVETRAQAVHGAELAGRRVEAQRGEVT